MRTAILSLLMALACRGETSVAPPSIGVVRDCDGRIRRVFGVPGAFLLGQPEAATDPAVLAPPRRARIEGRSLIILTAEGIEKRIALPHAAGPLQRMDEGWLAAQPFAIRLTGDGASIYRLPMKACAASFTEVAR